MNWIETNLGEHIDIKHGYAFEGKYFSDEGEYILLTPGNFEMQGGLKLDPVKTKYFVGDIPEEYLLQKNDIIVVMTDLIQNAPLLGGSLRIPESHRYLLNQRLGLVCQKEESTLDPRFLYHIFNTYPYRAQVRGSATGATVRHTAPSRILRCTVKIPRDLGTQRSIATLLDAYNDLIDNNRRKMVLLEEAAQQLYKEWFVRLRFPGHECKSGINGVPNGWEMKPVGDWLTSHIGGGWGEEAVMSEHTDPGFVIRGTDLPNVAVGQVDRVPFRFHKPSNIKSRMLIDGDIVFEASGGSKGQPVGRSLLISSDILESFDAPVICASFCKKLRPAKREYSEYINLHLKFIREVGYMDVFATQSASNITNFKFTAFLAHHSFLRPTQDVLDKFNSIVGPVFKQIRLLGRQNLRLTEARDLLLPRLMSGEIEI